MRRNHLPIHNPLPPTPLDRARLMPLAPPRLPDGLPDALPILALVHMTERAPVPEQPVPLNPTLGPCTLVLCTVPAGPVREAGIARGGAAGVVLAELAAGALAVARAAGVVAAVLAAERRRAAVVAQVAAARAVGARARLVPVAEAAVVAGGQREKEEKVVDHPAAAVRADGIAALGVLARVPRAVPRPLRRVHALVATRPGALVGCAEGRFAFAAVGAVGVCACVCVCFGRDGERGEVVSLVCWLRNLRVLQRRKALGLYSLTSR